MVRGLLRGLAAGAAGTTALNAVTYADMAWRGRPASEVPSQTIDKLAHDAGHPVPGDQRTRANRLEGLGALTGIGAGVAVGVLVSAARAAGLRLPAWAGPAAVAGLAMAMTDVPMARMGVSDPRSWSRSAWLSDIVPHLAYGLVTHATLVSLEKRR